jgi:hypothetical protein
MNNSFPRLIDGMCATLRSEVLTRLDDEFARGQVFGVINLLNTFKSRADWSAGFLAEQLAVQCEALNQVQALGRGLAGAPMASEAVAPAVVSSAELLAQRDELNRQITLWLHWLADHRTSLAPEQAQAMEAPLRLAMKREIEIELKHSPRPLFAEMSSGQES